MPFYSKTMGQFILFILSRVYFLWKARCYHHKSERNEPIPLFHYSSPVMLELLVFYISRPVLSHPHTYLFLPLVPSVLLFKKKKSTRGFGLIYRSPVACSRFGSLSECNFTFIIKRLMTRIVKIPNGLHIFF